MAWTLDHWYDGGHQAPASGRYLERTSPVDGTLVCRVADGGPEDVAAAVASAQRALRGGRRTSASVRGETTRSAVTWSSSRLRIGEYQKKSRLFCFTIAGLSSILMPSAHSPMK